MPRDVMKYLRRALQNKEGIWQRMSTAEIARVRRDWAEDARTHSNPILKQPNRAELTQLYWRGSGWNDR